MGMLPFPLLHFAADDATAPTGYRKALFQMSRCRSCRHYFITHDPKNPHGCRALRFKGRRMPDVTVKVATPDLDCQCYAPKPTKPPANLKIRK